MKDEVIKTVLGIVKGSILLVVAGAVFYMVYPKYTFKTFQGVTPVERCNQITGKVEVFGKDDKWVDLENL